MAGWKVRGFHEHIWLVQRSGWSGAVDLPRWSTAVAPEAAASRVDEWFPDGWGDAPGASTLAEIAAALGEVVTWSEEDVRPRLKDLLREALRVGRIVAARMELPAPAGGVDDVEEDGRPAERVRRDESTWIEIVLVDSGDPPRPVPHQRYRVELPGGDVREGRLDDGGRAMILGLDPGTCQVTFPDLDEAVWQRA